jgi:uncharacterized protein
MSDTEPLDRDACLELMRTTGLGRVAWTAEDGRVVVEPVNFALDDDGVVFRTGEGDKLDAVRRGTGPRTGPTSCASVSSG